MDVRTALRGAFVVVMTATSIAAFARGDLPYGTYCAITAVAAVVTVALLRRYRVHPPLVAEGFIAALAIADMTFGNLLGFYRSLPYYDKALHLGTSLALGLFVVHLVREIRVASGSDRRRWLDAVATILLVVGIGACWELAEYAVDVTFARRTQGSPGMSPHADTMFDLALDAFGACVAAALGPSLARRSRLRAAMASAMRACRATPVLPSARGSTAARARA